MDVKTRDGLESAIALKFRAHSITTSVTYNRKHAFPYRAVIRKEHHVIGSLTNDNLGQLKKMLTEWIEAYISPYHITVRKGPYVIGSVESADPNRLLQLTKELIKKELAHKK